MGLLTEIPSRSWKRIEAVFLGDVIARSSRHPRARMRFDERSVQRPRETTVPYVWPDGDGRLKKSRLTTQPYAVVRDPDGGTREEPPPEERGAAQTLDRGPSWRSSPRSATSRSSSAGRRTSRTASCSCSRPGPSPHKSSLSRCESHDGKRT